VHGREWVTRVFAGDDATGFHQSLGGLDLEAADVPYLFGHTRQQGRWQRRTADRCILIMMAMVSDRRA
jgi:hypothetical protein